VRSALHGGLTPPLLVARCRFAGENDYRAAHRTSLQKATFAVRKRRFARAAGVGPPWQAKRDYDGAASLTRKRTPSSTAIVSPPWLSEPHLQLQCDEFRRLDLACGVHSTGGLRPPLLLLILRASAGRMTIFAMNKRTFTRAAGVSPPWFGRHVYADTRAIARKTADSMWADHRCHRVQRYHGGLTPPLLVGNASARRIMRIPAASSTGTSLRPGTRPATHAYCICGFDTFTTAGTRHPPLVASADAVANVRFWPTKKMLFHGGLTPPAPGCTTFVRCEKRHSRCTNARL
jgi:hypothetical protein